MLTTAKIIDYDGDCLTLRPEGYIDTELLHKSVDKVEIRLVDGRTITAEQRKKAYALINDIARWSGHLPEEIKAYSKADFQAQSGEEDFSLSNCTVDTAREYITHLVEFCLRHGVPCMDRMLNRTDDIDRYLYLCLQYRRCAVCGRPADFHHCEGSRVGMGRNREEVPAIGAVGMALCRVHHVECHTIGEDTFNKKYHVYGTKLDKHLCGCLGVKGQEEKYAQNNCLFTA